MKICVTANDSGLDAQVDPRFGRCQYFTIVDSETMQFESMENESIASSGGAGIQAAQFITNKGVEIVLTGNVGPNASNTLKAAGIKVIIGVSGTVKEVIDSFQNGELAFSTSGPSVDAHFGMGSGRRKRSVLPGSDKNSDMASSGIPSSAPSSLKLSQEEEIERLKEQSASLSSQMDQVLQRLDHLEKREESCNDKGVTGITKIQELLEEKEAVKARGVFP